MDTNGHESESVVHVPFTIHKAVGAAFPPPNFRLNSRPFVVWKPGRHGRGYTSGGSPMIGVLSMVEVPPDWSFSAVFV